MDIFTAINRAALSLLLEDELSWEDKGTIKTCENTLTLNGMISLNRSITISQRDNSKNDNYYFDCVLQAKNGNVLFTHELRISLPHMEETIDKQLTREELSDFIALNETSKDNIQTHWLGSHNYDKDLIRFAEGVFKQKGTVPVKKKV